MDLSRGRSDGFGLSRRYTVALTRGDLQHSGNGFALIWPYLSRSPSGKLARFVRMWPKSWPIFWRNMAWGILIWIATGWDAHGWIRIGVRMRFQALLGHFGPQGISSGPFSRFSGFWGGSPWPLLFPWVRGPGPRPWARGDVGTGGMNVQERHLVVWANRSTRFDG